LAVPLHKLDCPRLTTAVRRAATVAVVAVLTASAPQAALADGDPASDVLLGQNTFLPADAAATSAQQARLQASLDAAARSGFPIRVAVIGSQSDLGSVTALWRQPQLYARFLDQELSLAYKGPVVVVMPDGVGVASATPLSAAEHSAGASPGALPARRGLAAVAQSTVAKLASAAGHPLPASVLASTTVPRASGSSPTGAIAYLVLAIGAVLIALAWAASFRARPPQPLARRRAPS
jgi:hypothetical protein